MLCDTRIACTLQPPHCLHPHIARTFTSPAPSHRLHPHIACTLCKAPGKPTAAAQHPRRQQNRARPTPPPSPHRLTHRPTWSPEPHIVDGAYLSSALNALLLDAVLPFARREDVLGFRHSMATSIAVQESDCYMPATRLLLGTTTGDHAT